jgi:multiple antibiotic resistance protein
MNAGSHSFINLLFIGIIALFPVVNPLGSAFMVAPYFAGLSKPDKRAAVTKITLYSFSICTISLFAGHYVLQVFGLSIPVIQLAGGIMICKLGWDSLSADKKPLHPEAETAENADAFVSLQNKLFYPITFPVTTGAGTISVLFTLSAHTARAKVADYFISTGAILSAIVVTCIMIYICYLNARNVIRFLGSNGEVIINRISAFLIFCVGLQIATSGITTLFHL